MDSKDKCCDCACIHSDKIDGASQSLKDIKSFARLSEFFKAFGDETRLKIMCILDSQNEMCVCDIAYSLNMTKSAISHQLKYLKKCGLVKCRKKGKIVFYSLSDEHVSVIFEMGVAHLKEEE